MYLKIDRELVYSNKYSNKFAFVRRLLKFKKKLQQGGIVLPLPTEQLTQFQAY